METVMDRVSLLELLKREEKLCATIRGLEYTMGQAEGTGGRLYDSLAQERSKAEDQLAVTRVSIGAKLALYTQLYGDSIRNALGILTGSAEEGEENA